MFHGIKRVSIHALLAESDDKETAFVMNNHGFNPRPPCGERPGPIIFPFKLDRFQSTPSLRRATSPLFPHLLEQGVSIHALLAESDAEGRSYCRRKSHVSIHALLAESDYCDGNIPCAHPGFNPRPPCGERPKSTPEAPPDMQFQSTPSLRRATASTVHVANQSCKRGFAPTSLKTVHHIPSSLHHTWLSICVFQCLTRIADFPAI